MLTTINKMEIKKENSGKILSILARGIFQDQTATILAKELKMSRWGVWKILKELEKKGLIILISLGSGKTNTHLIRLNWKNDLLEKTLSLIFAQEAAGYGRWKFAFSELEAYADFLILYGSILHSPKEAGDIDIISVVSNKKNFLKIDDIIKEKQVTQSKKIHDINFTLKEFKSELQKPNKAFIDAIKKGIVLFGQEKFIKFIRKIKNDN